MIEVKNIVKRYGNLEVLRNVSVSIGAGEVVSIVGPSGAGKTTLLQIMGTLDGADSGQVLYDGVEVLRMKDRELARFRNRNIGFVFQFHHLLPEFSALENIMIPAMIAGKTKKEAVIEPLCEDFLVQKNNGKAQEELKIMADNILFEIINYLFWFITY